MKIVKNQVHHYVPQFLMRNFSFGKKHQIWVFDKRTGREFPTNVDKIAREKGFYNYPDKGIENSLEPFLSEVDSDAAEIITEIIQGKSLASLDEEKRGCLSGFLAIQFLRTRRRLEGARDITSALETALEEQGADPLKVSGFQPFDEEEARIELVKSIQETAMVYAPILFQKSWFLFDTDRRSPFLISDHPMAMQNLLDTGPYGNLGLAVKGIEIYLPLGETFTLALYCPSIEEKLRESYKSYRKWSFLDPVRAAQGVLDPLALEWFNNAMETGCAVPQRPENVANLNSLQVWHSSRFVFSRAKKFALAKRMIKDDPRCRQAPKPVVG